MGNDDRTIVDGIWSDCFAGEHDQGNGRLRFEPVINDGQVVSVQNPLPTDGGSVYCQDIWTENSITTDWDDIDDSGEPLPCIPFTNLHTRIENSTGDNPKILLIHFNRSVRASEIGLGCTGGGDFSNVQIELIGSGGVTRTAIDESTDSTKYTSRNFEFTNDVFNAVRFTFHTADTVSLSNITIPKSTSVSVSQTEPTTDSLKVISYSHAELHSGSHYVYREYHLMLKDGVQEHLIITPDATRWAHMTIGVEAVESSVVVEIIEDVTYTSPGNIENTRNRNRNFPDNNTTVIYENPVGVVGADLLQDYWLGAGKNKGGGEARDSEEILLKQNTAYLLRLTEQNIQATVVNIVFDWYEHTNKNTL